MIIYVHLKLLFSCLPDIDKKIVINCDIFYKVAHSSCMICDLV